MKRITAILAVAVIIGILIFSCVQSEKRITLRFKYEPGVKLIYKQEARRNVSVTEADSVTRREVHTYHVTAEMECLGFVDDTTAEINERGIWEYEAPSEEDSTKTEIKERVTETLLRCLPNGKVVEVEILNDKDQPRVNYLKNYYEQGIPIFPAGEIPIGYSWTQSTKVVLPEETMEASTTYQIKSEARQAGYDCVVLEYQGNMVIPLAPSSTDSTRLGGLERIKISGVLYFAHKEGFVVEQKEKWTIDADRKSLREGKVVSFRAVSEYDVRFWLEKVERET